MVAGEVGGQRRRGLAARPWGAVTMLPGTQLQGAEVQSSQTTGGGRLAGRPLGAPVSCPRDDPGPRGTWRGHFIVQQWLRGRSPSVTPVSWPLSTRQRLSSPRGLLRGVGSEVALERTLPAGHLPLLPALCRALAWGWLRAAFWEPRCGSRLFLLSTPCSEGFSVQIVVTERGPASGSLAVPTSPVSSRGVQRPASQVLPALSGMVCRQCPPLPV